ncbi:MAG: deoxyribodipyrimidine photo-lyase, partial [Pseudomonadota bacterium]
MSEKTPLLLWFRQDLRLGDNPALRAAAATGQQIVPIFIHDEEGAGAWSAGGASRWWLDKSLRALAASLGALGTSLVLRTGPASKVLKGLVSETKARAVYWNRCYEPFAVARDKALMASLKSDGLEVKTFNGALLFEPWEVETGSGTPYKVFTSFWKAARQGKTPAEPEPAPTTLKSVKKPPASEDLDDWGLHPSNPDWSAGFDPVWTPGEAGALARLDDFLDEAVN